MRLLLIILLLYPVVASSQELRPADPKLAAEIFRKHQKATLFRQTNYVRGDYAQNEREGVYYADVVASTSLITAGMGRFYTEPDYQVWVQAADSSIFGYPEIYKLEIFDNARNDSIAEMSSLYPYWRNQISTCTWLFYDNKTGNLRYFDTPNLSTGFKYRKDQILSMEYPNLYHCDGSFSYKRKRMTLYPNKEDIKIYLESLLTKNIYANRFVRSGLLDSLTVDGHFYQKEDTELFPLLDELIPDLSTRLTFRPHFWERSAIGKNCVLWTFFYPGVDMLTDAGEFTKIDTTWTKYVDLKPQFYTMAYDTIRHQAYFLNGDDISVSYDAYYREYFRNFNTREWDEDAAIRIRTLYATEWFRSYNANAFSNDWYKWEVAKYEREDSLYWYFSNKNNMTFTLKEVDMKNYRFVYRKETGDYVARMSKSKKDLGRIEIAEKHNCRYEDVKIHFGYIFDHMPIFDRAKWKNLKGIYDEIEE